VGLVVVVLTFFHPPATRRWILTGTRDAQAVYPLSALTAPRATRDLTARRVTDLEIPKVEQSVTGGGTWNAASMRTAPLRQCR